MRTLLKCFLANAFLIYTGDGKANAEAGEGIGEDGKAEQTGRG